jgi:hypothetical protein
MSARLTRKLLSFWRAHVTLGQCLIGIIIWGIEINKTYQCFVLSLKSLVQRSFGVFLRERLKGG